MGILKHSLVKLSPTFNHLEDPHIEKLSASAMSFQNDMTYNSIHGISTSLKNREYQDILMRFI